MKNDINKFGFNTMPGGRSFEKDVDAESLLTVLGIDEKDLFITSGDEYSDEKDIKIESLNNEIARLYLKKMSSRDRKLIRILDAEITVLEKQIEEIIYTK